MMRSGKLRTWRALRAQNINQSTAPLARMLASSVMNRSRSVKEVPPTDTSVAFPYAPFPWASRRLNAPRWRGYIA